jgi:glutamine amidotransferase
MIGIIDYGSGNIDAIIFALKLKNIPFKRLSSLNDFHKNITHLMLPGVGGFDETMDLLDEKRWIPWLNEKVVNERFPILGVCVGMQILVNGSSEGIKNGFGWIKGYVKKLPFHEKLPLPHMGWNSIKLINSPFSEGINPEIGFYFLHNYFVCPDDDSVIFSTSNYIVNIPTIIIQNNIVGVQFHPEKSLANGARLFLNFYRHFKRC